MAHRCCLPVLSASSSCAHISRPLSAYRPANPAGSCLHTMNVCSNILIFSFSYHDITNSTITITITITTTITVCTMNLRDVKAKLPWSTLCVVAAPGKLIERLTPRPNRPLSYIHHNISHYISKHMDVHLYTAYQSTKINKYWFPFQNNNAIANVMYVCMYVCLP